MKDCDCGSFCLAALMHRACVSNHGPSPAPPWGRLARTSWTGGETIQQRGATPARAIQDYSYRTRAGPFSEFEAMWQIMPLGRPKTA